MSALAFAIQLGFGSAAWSAGPLPQGATVVNGQVVITKPTDTSMQINASGGSIVNWQQFSIGAGNQVRIALPSASSAILNRVTGPDASQLMGSLQSNGRVFLINPNGIVVGSGARIDTNSFIASTLNMADADFLAGKLRFLATTGAGGIRNDGVISAGPGGRVALIAPDIQNTGIIQAPDGKILLAAGRSLEIASLDFEGVTFEIQAPTDAVLNLGQLLADNGAVSVFAGSLRNSGEIRATRMVQDADGSIVLSGSNEVSLSQGSVTAANGLGGGNIRIESAGTTRVAGSVSATGSAGKGGGIQILGDRVALEAGARVDASGSTGGGRVLVGGDFQGNNPSIQNATRVYVDADAALRADAVHQGDGGQVVVWADENTRYFGSLSARGGTSGGNGGSAEVSGKQNLQFAGSADLSAPAGQSGSLLLDPLDILVSGTGGVLSTVVDEFSDFAGNVVTISPTAMNNIKGNVTLQAERDIYFNSAVALTTAGAGLTATAGGTTFNAAGGGQIYMNQAISTTGGNVTLRAVGISGSAAISTNGGAVDIQTSGSENYSGAITTAGGAVRLGSGAGSVSSANVNAGSGAVTLTTAAGSISSSTLTGGTVTLAATGGSVSNVYVNAATQVNASSSSSSIYLLNYNSQPLRVGTITSPSTVELRSDSGFAQATGGSITASLVNLYNGSSTTAMGSLAAPLQIAAPRLTLSGISSGMLAPAHIQFAGSPTLTSLSLSGNLAALSTSTISGAANLSTFSLGVSNGALNIAADSGAVSGLGSGLSITVSDAGITAPTLNVLGGNITLNSAAGLTIGSLSAASLYATAKGAVSLGTITTTGSSGIYVSTNACTTSYVGCAAVSPITADTLSAGGTGAVTLRTYDNGDITVTNSLSAYSASLTAGNLYYIVSSYPYYTMRTANNITLASATTGNNFSISHNGIGDIALGSLAATGYVSINAGTSYLVQQSGFPYGNTVTTDNQIQVNLAEPTSTTSSLQVRNSGLGNVGISGAIARPSGGVTVEAENGNVTLANDVSASSSVSISASGAVALANVTSTNNAVQIDAGTTLTVGRVLAGSLTGTGNYNTSLLAGGDIRFESVTSQAHPTYGPSGYGSVTITSSGSIMALSDNTSADISASGNVTLNATNTTVGIIGNSSFANPLDIVSGASTSNTVTLSAGANIGAVGRAVNVDTVGTLIANTSGGAFFVAAKALDSATQRSLTGIQLTASAAGIGNGATSTLTSQNLSVSASSDGSTLTIGDVVQSTGALNMFRFTALNSGLAFGNVNLATTGYNQFYLTSSSALTQTSAVTTNNITAGAVVLNAGLSAMTVGNIVSANTVGNEVNLTGGAITAGSISGRSVKVAGIAAVSLGSVTSVGTTKYPNYVSVPRLGTSQYVTDELRITAAGALSTGNISSATSAYLSGAGVSVGGGSGTVTAGVNDNYYIADQVNLQSGTGTLGVGNISGYDVSMTGTTLQVGAVTAVRTLTAGNASTASLSATSLTNAGTITAYGGPSITVNAGAITTGALTTAGSLAITANTLGGKTYTPGAVALTAANTTITADNGINLTSTTLTSPTVTLNASASNGNIIGALSNTTNLTLYSGGMFNVSSNAAISTLVVTANGGLAGAGAGSAVSDVSGNEILKVVENSGALALTYKASTGATRSTYNESNVSLTGITASTASTLLSGSSVTITADSAVNTAPGLSIAGGSLNIATGGDITLTSVSTGSGSVTADSRGGAVTLASVTTTTGAVSATAAGGDVTLSSVTTAGGAVTASATGSTGDVNVTTVVTTGTNGGSVTLSSANGSIVAQGGGLNVDTRSSAGAASGTTTLTAANGSVGTDATQFKASGSVNLVVNARNAINVDMANTDLTGLTVTTRASGSGAIAITNSNNFSGLSITRANGTDLNLSALSPRTASAFSLTARDGNINVLGDISSVTNLTLDAGYGQSAGGNLNILAPGGSARSITATGALTLKAQGDVVLAAGAANTDSLTVQSGNTATITAGGDIQITADGGSVLVNQSPQNFVYSQNLTAGGDIVVRGGQGTASAQVLSLGGQTLSADGDLKILGGAAGASGGFAKVQSSAGTQTVSANNLVLQGGSAGAYAALQGVTQSAQFLRGQVSITGGSGAGAYAEMKGTGTGTQTVGYQSYFYNSDFTDGVTVQGGSGSGAYASLASAGRQNVYTTGNIAVLAGSGVNAHADITAANRQNLGDTQNYSSYNYTYRPTDSVLVQASGTGTAKITAGNTQVVLAGTGGIRVLGGSAVDMNASIETTSGSQEVGSSSTGSEVATAFITVQGGAGGSAWIKASGNQTLMTGGNLDVLGGSGANTTAFIESTAGSQNIGYTYIYSNDALDTLRISGGTGSGAAAWIRAATGQTVDAGGDILLTGGATGAYADLSTTTGTQTVGNQNGFYYDQTNTLALTGGSGSGAYARVATLGGSQTLRAATGMTFTGGPLDGAGAWALAATGQNVGTAGTLAITGGGGNAANPNETGLRNTTSGTQTVSATTGITLVGGVAGSSTWIKQAGSGAQTISTSGSLLLTAPVEGADEVSITAGAGGQTVSVTGLLSLSNAGAGTMKLSSGGNQTLSAASMEVLNSATTSTSPQTSVQSSGNMQINLSGSTNQNATLTVANLSGVTESQAFIESSGSLVVAMDYLKAGLMQVGGTGTLGESRVYSIGDQTLVVGQLLIQGGANAVADANVSAGSTTSSTMLISTLSGPVQVLGGAAGSATIDPLNLNVVSNGSIQITGGTTSTAGSNVTAGVINMTATNGNMAVIGGGATATVLAATTATVAGVNTFNLTNSGGLTFSGGGTASATGGGNVQLGAACTGCASGLVGPFSVTAPAAAAASVTASTNLLVTDPAAYWDQASLDLAAAGYELVVAEDGTVTTRRRSLVQCY